MPLIICGDCQKKYSDYASACPKCARPTDTQASCASAETKKNSKFQKGRKAKILVIDHESHILKVLVTRLQLSGYQVFSATKGEEALEAFHRESPDLIVIDVMLPEMDGFEICRKFRADFVVPIIFLNASVTISESVAGLDLGSVDYLSKPFEFWELTNKITTLIFNSSFICDIKSPSVMKFGNLEIDFPRQHLSIAGERISLTSNEFGLLELLFEKPFVPSSEIFEAIWGYEPIGEIDLRMVNDCVARLRDKLEPDPRNPEIILTVDHYDYVLGYALDI